MSINIDPVSYTISSTAILVALIGAGWGAIKYYTKKQVDNRFNKKIEGFKNELQIVLESKKFDFQRLTFDFNLYRNKKHECYPELYKLIMKAVFGTQSLINNWDFPEFEKYSEDMLRKYLINKGVADDKIDELSLQFKNGIINEFVKYEVKMAEWYRVNDDYKRAHEYFWTIEIFISDDIVKLSEALFTAGDSIMRSLAWDIMGNAYGNHEEIKNIRPPFDSRKLFEIIYEQSQLIKNNVKRELSIADYESSHS
ncbi:hypothetical protein H7B90_00730 [Cohnella xylanilytica]|uniref:Phage abortive infection protein n=1 Tax=Cohnella xylanilytica TaxID=557555 RepID=A0A841TNL3_9BACL|nr:hypothetical protein [Cohnella xylanilytica]MBB6689916.1 hypothetical protein [Cohnella xylanilytica]